MVVAINGQSLEAKAQSMPQTCSIGPNTKYWANIVRMFSEKYDKSILEQKRRDSQNSLRVKEQNLYLAHLTNSDKIRNGNLFQQVYYSIKDAFTQRELQEARINVENTCLYFTQ